VIEKRQEKNSGIIEKRTPRCQVAINMMKLIATTYPAKWTANDIAIQLGINVRTINRVLSDMLQAQLFERRYNSYTLSLNVIEQFYGAQWAVKQEVNKSLMLTNKKNNPRRD
jgi:uncharacterized membrane-anchored protein